MDKYIGTKLIEAIPMNIKEASKKLKKEIQPGSDNYSGEGYFVTYEDGYTSWSPKEVFEKAYNNVNTCMNFGQAIYMMKLGFKVARQGWNGKNMFIVIMPELNLPPYNTQGTNRKVNDRTAKWIGEDKPLESQAYIAMYTAQEKWQPGWLASQSDMLSDDWLIVE